LITEFCFLVHVTLSGDKGAKPDRASDESVDFVNSSQKIQYASLTSSLSVNTQESQLPSKPLEGCDNESSLCFPVSFHPAS
jgi:hypothetical protein